MGEGMPLIYRRTGEMRNRRVLARGDMCRDAENMATSEDENERTPDVTKIGK